MEDRAGTGGLVMKSGLLLEDLVNRTSGRRSNHDGTDPITARRHWWRADRIEAAEACAVGSVAGCFRSRRKRGFWRRQLEPWVRITSERLSGRL